MPEEDKEVKQHFDLNSADYDRWMGSASHGMMHYGDHSQYERNLKEKILSLTGLTSLNEIRNSVVHRVEALAEKADIQEGETVVDSGCGRGGNTIWLARNTDAEKVIGLDIDSDLIEKARENAEEAGVEDKTEFIEGDFDNLPLEDFDVYFAVESQCYSENEEKLTEQIFNKINPGGRIVISDGFRTEEFSEEDMEVANKMHKGWGVDYMAYRENFERYLKQAGFKNIQVEPLMDKIGPTSKYLHRASVLTTPYVDLRLLIAEARHKAASKILGVEKESYRHSAKRYNQLRNLLTTGRYQYIAGKKGIFNQYDFYAEKPES
ncbi:methyltransferase domain-containing protein [Candidatus Nanohaloarchaea archaeon]|nr:methyltransferase domain-containing protein [Candidatus Nanohaloarchaea archaeon]